MIRILVVNCTPILDCTKDEGTTAVDTASDDMLMATVQAIGDFSLLVSQPNHSDLTHTAVGDVLNAYYKKKRAIQGQTMLKSAKAKVYDQFARKAHLIHDLKIHTICSAKEVQVNGAEMVPTTKQRKLQIHLNGARQAAIE